MSVTVADLVKAVETYWDASGSQSWGRLFSVTHPVSRQDAITYLRPMLAAIAEQLNAPPPDRRPHSRACGWRDHPHGDACAPDCPTCLPIRGTNHQ